MKQVPNVTSVETDMDAHTVSVAFDDDDASLDAIMRALDDAGFEVSSHEPES